MSNLATYRGTRFLGQAAAIAIVAGTVAGCSADVARFGGMFDETDNQAAIVNHPRQSPDMMATGSIRPLQPSRPASVVTGNTLPPAPGAVASDAPFVRPAGALPAPPALPSTSTASNWSPQSGTSITVRDGDSIKVLARRYGVSEQALMAANSLSANAQLAPGQTLIIPGAANAATTVANNVRAAAPTLPVAPTLPATPALNAANAASTLAPGPAILGQLPPTKPAMPRMTDMAAAAPAVAMPGSYTVKPGDSLGKIAAAHGVRSTDLLKANGMQPEQSVRIGQVLRIPAAAAPVATSQVAAAFPGTASDAAPDAVMPPIAAAKPANPAPAQQVAAAAPPAAAVAKPSVPATQVSAPVQAAADGSFRWPVRGRVISGFGVKPDGDRNDGINIEVPEGTPIKAAEGGEVIYAGNELKGFGNLVLVKHSNGFVSAYAHASEILVRRGDQISRGQTIAKVGTTGNVSRPQLHFELREGNRPVDPMPLLSG
jgi:murein DD-endopeptidase MepM/ murein hydrolase activator NlpD